MSASAPSAPTALVFAGVTSPVPYPSIGRDLLTKLQVKGEQLLSRAATRVWSYGVKAFIQQVIDQYSNVDTSFDAATAVDSLVRQRVIRQWIINFEQMYRLRGSGSGSGSEAVAKVPWIPERFTCQLEVLRRYVTAFNHWSTTQPIGMPYSLELLFAKAGTTSFDQAFDDSRIPSAIRLAYYSHYAIRFHILALHLAYRGRLPQSTVEPVTEAFELDLRRALGLALGLPGTAHLQTQSEVEFGTIEVLDIDDEYARWSKYLRTARPIE